MLGAARAGTLSLTLTSKHFTGQYHETNLTGDAGLYDYGARWYDPRIGRFLSPDSIVPEPGNPQTLNRYSYANNNPVVFNDPSGHIVRRGGVGSNPGGSGPAPSQAPFPGPWPFPHPFEWLAQLLGFPSDSQIEAVTGVPGISTDIGRHIYGTVDGANQVLVPVVEGGLSLLNPVYDLATSITGRTVTGTSLDASTRAMGIVLVGVEFTPFDELLAIGKNLGNTQMHHWFPRQFHSLIRRDHPEIPQSALDLTEPINTTFHYMVHGMGGTRDEAYNAAVQALLADQSMTDTQFVQEIAKLREDYMRLYQDFIVNDVP